MQRGYTIPELLVVAAIMVFMTGLFVPLWRSGQRTLALDRVVHKAGQDVRQAQELALRAQAYTCGSGNISGYGIFFDQNTPTSYLIFADCNGNNAYQAGTDGLIETIQIESGITIQSVSPSPQASIVFLPPTPTIFINPGSVATAQVVFQRADGAGETRIVDISNKGVIDID